jgi:hypothetical protein
MHLLSRRVLPIPLLLALVFAVPFSGMAQSSAASETAKKSAVPYAATSEVKPPAQLLDDEELTELSRRNQDPGPEVKGGALSNEHLTYIAIALAAAVLVLVLK